MSYDYQAVRLVQILVNSLVYTTRPNTATLIYDSPLVPLCNPCNDILASGGS
jgi:hypothetical protein